MKDPMRAPWIAGDFGALAREIDVPEAEPAMAGPFPERIAQPGMLVTSPPENWTAISLAFLPEKGQKKAARRIPRKGHNQEKIIYALKQSEAGSRRRRSAVNTG
jgi:hypothetical protein